MNTDDTPVDSSSTATSSTSNGELNNSNSSHATGTTSASNTNVSAASILEALQSQKEWAKAIAFEADGRIIAATVKPLDGEMDAFLKLFDKREDTIASGIILLNEQYDVHRFHPPLIYGRRGDPLSEDGEGIAVCKIDKKSTKQPVFCLITYTYPTISARAVPQLKEFCENQRK